jgi:hypothetical protein
MVEGVQDPDLPFKEIVEKVARQASFRNNFARNRTR